MQVHLQGILCSYPTRLTRVSYCFAQLKLICSRGKGIPARLSQRQRILAIAEVAKIANLDTLITMIEVYTDRLSPPSSAEARVLWSGDSPGTEARRRRSFVVASKGN